MLASCLIVLVAVHLALPDIVSAQAQRGGQGASATGKPDPKPTGERVRIPTRPPEVTYISTFAPGRSEAEIEASNAANQKQQDALRADQAAREEKAKDAYRALGRATGLDVDAMEREIKRDEAREQAASSGVADRKQ